jgi:hypothetical protein
MTHRRQEIRDAVVTMLSGLAGGRVYSNRELAIEADSLPAINVYTVEEDAAPFTASQKTYRRTLTLVIDVLAKNVDDAVLDNTLDDLAESVEAALVADTTASGKAIDTRLTSTTVTRDSSGEVPIGVLKLTYQAVYIA